MFDESVQVQQRAQRYRDVQRRPLDFAFHSGQDVFDPPGRIAEVGNDVDGGGTTAAEVFAGGVAQRLVAGIGVHRGHHGIFHAKGLVQDLQHQRRDIGGRRAGRDNAIPGGNGVFVYTQDHQIIHLFVGDGGQDHAPGARNQVLCQALAGTVLAGRVDDDIHVKGVPGHIAGLYAVNDARALFAVHQIVGFQCGVYWIAAVGLQEVVENFRRANFADGHHLQIGAV